jgi:hypothetical protein
MDEFYLPRVTQMPFPMEFEDDPLGDQIARMSRACATSELIYAFMKKSGQEPVISEDDKLTARRVFDGTLPTPHKTTSLPTAISLHITALLNEYDIAIVESAQQIRNLCMNLLVEKAVSGKSEGIQLRAVEMLGKVKDVGLFEERTTILVEHLSTDEIKRKLLQTVGKLYQTVGTEFVDTAYVTDTSTTQPATMALTDAPTKGG